MADYRVTAQPQLFLNLDGVLADFDTHYARSFGEPIDRQRNIEPPNLWANIHGYPGPFFADLPLMADADALWWGALTFHPNPVLLSGIPTSVWDAAAQKRSWVDRNFGPHVPLICCPSAHKRRHGRPGDVLIDDWAKYRHLWEAMGGIFILHTSAATTLQALTDLRADGRL